MCIRDRIKSFLSKQKETYKVPYETHPADRLRQCVFAGTTNRQDFLPRDRTGNRRFIPIPVDAELAEVHILDNEEESRAYIDQLWAEAMTIYNSGDYKLAFSPAMQETLQAHQQDFMHEDAQAGMIYAFLEDYTGDRVCSKQLYAEALGNTNIPAEWETRAICEIDVYKRQHHQQQQRQQRGCTEGQFIHHDQDDHEDSHCQSNDHGKCHRTFPVSYTHLDVYKRQLHKQGQELRSEQTVTPLHKQRNSLLICAS